MRFPGKNMQWLQQNLADGTGLRRSPPGGGPSPPQGQDVLLSDCPELPVTKATTRTPVQGSGGPGGVAFAKGCLPPQLCVAAAPAWCGEARGPGWLMAGCPEGWREQEP